MLSSASAIPHGEGHGRGGELSNLILGGQDGMVNVLGVILGLAAASPNPEIVLAGGLAATFAESISMGAVAYTSGQAERDFYHAEMAREQREIKDVPEIERDEVRTIFREFGLEGAPLEQVTRAITANPDAWLKVMMAEELKLQPARRNSLHSALVVGVSAVVGSLIPLVPFFLVPSGALSRWAAIGISLGISALCLFGVGIYKAKMTVGRPGRSGLQMAVIGIVSALSGYLVGTLFGVKGG